MNEVRPLWGHHNSLTQSRAQPTFSNKNPDCQLIFHLNPLKTIQAHFYNFCKIPSEPWCDCMSFTTWLLTRAGTNIDLTLSSVKRLQRPHYREVFSNTWNSILERKRPLIITSQGLSILFLSVWKASECNY